MQRAPGAALLPYVALMWAQDQPDTHATTVALDRGEVGDGGGRGCRPHLSALPAAVVAEHVLPTGFTHIVFRSSPAPSVQLVERSPGRELRTLPDAVIGGPRDSFYLKKASKPLRSVGVLLRPGSVRTLLGIPAHAIAGQHVGLADVWGPYASELRDELLAIACPVQRLARLEAVLLERLIAASAVEKGVSMHPAVAQAVRGMAETARVGPWVQDMSHRHFIHLFRDAVGLVPKAFARVQRVRSALQQATLPGAVLAQVAAQAGYADQSHFHRDVRAVTGVSPSVFVKLSHDGGSHLRLPGGSNLYKTSAS